MARSFLLICFMAISKSDKNNEDSFLLKVQCILTGEEGWQGCKGDCHNESPNPKHQWFSFSTGYPTTETVGTQIRHVSSHIKSTWKIIMSQLLCVLARQEVNLWVSESLHWSGTEYFVSDMLKDNDHPADIVTTKTCFSSYYYWSVGGEWKDERMMIVKMFHPLYERIVEVGWLLSGIVHFWYSYYCSGDFAEKSSTCFINPQKRYTWMPFVTWAVACQQIVINFLFVFLFFRGK